MHALRHFPWLVNGGWGLVEGMVVDLNSRSILDKNEEVFFNTWDEIAQGEGEASLNMLTPNSSPNSGSALSFMYTRTLLRPYSFNRCAQLFQKPHSCHGGPVFAMMHSFYDSENCFRNFPPCFHGFFYFFSKTQKCAIL